MAKARQQFLEYLEGMDVDISVYFFSSPVVTAQDAANATGRPLSSIVKSLIFQAGEKFVLCLVGGDRRVDEGELKRQTEKGEIIKAHPDYIRKVLGFSVGGVPPFGHTHTLPTFMDRTLFKRKELFASAGSVYSLFSITPKLLRKLTKAKVAEISS
ncbi:MAG TPA: YbaK/EbsC family protein [Patescibacteria group bacterium]|nr:YbaK/EbsC family protein [Patescibacteria group bacterium]